MQEISQGRLRYFHEVVACGSVRGAAEKLDTAASVVSRQIQLLEKELGVALFERRSRGLTPTEAADMLLEYYRACRAQQEHLGARLQELRGMQRGSVQLMISEGFIDSLMEHVVGPFCIEHPRINISVNVGSVNEVVEAVASDAAHIGLAYNPPVDPRLRCRASRKHPVCLLTRPDHALARHRAPLTIADILPYPFALMSAPYGLRQAVDLLEFTERIHLTPSLTTHPLRVLKQYAMSGAGVTLMPNLGVHHEVASGELVALSIAHPILSAPECQALLRLGRPLSSAASELMRRIELRLPAFSEGGRAREARQRPANDAAFREQCAGKRHPWLMLVRKWRYQAVSRQILPASDKIQAHPEVLIMSVMSDIKIRPLERGDLHFVHKINNNDVIMRYWFEEPYEAYDELVALYDRHLHDQNERRFIIERDTGEPAGLVELVEIDYIHRRAEFQIIIAPSYQGRGYAKAATRIAVGYAFRVLNLHKVYLVVDRTMPPPSISMSVAAFASRAC